MPAEQSNEKVKRQVVLKLNAEKVERLQTLAAIHWNDELANELRAALDSPPVAQYRIVGTNVDGVRWTLSVVGTESEAKKYAAELAAEAEGNWNRDVRVQVRAVTWVDLEEGERG